METDPARYCFSLRDSHISAYTAVARTAFADRFLRVCGEGPLQYSTPRHIAVPNSPFGVFTDNPKSIPAARSESHAYARGQLS